MFQSIILDLHIAQTHQSEVWANIYYSNIFFGGCSKLQCLKDHLKTFWMHFLVNAQDILNVNKTSWLERKDSSLYSCLKITVFGQLNCKNISRDSHSFNHLRLSCFHHSLFFGWSSSKNEHQQIYLSGS